MADTLAWIAADPVRANPAYYAAPDVVRDCLVVSANTAVDQMDKLIGSITARKLSLEQMLLFRNQLFVTSPLRSTVGPVGLELARGCAHVTRTIEWFRDCEEMLDPAVMQASKRVRVLNSDPFAPPPPPPVPQLVLQPPPPPPVAIAVPAQQPLSADIPMGVGDATTSGGFGTAAPFLAVPHPAAQLMQAVPVAGSLGAIEVPRVQLVPEKPPQPERMVRSAIGCRDPVMARINTSFQGGSSSGSARQRSSWNQSTSWKWTQEHGRYQ